MFLAFLTLLALPAHAYTLDDLVTAAQRGMSPSTLENLAQQGGPWTLAEGQVVLLLRAGLSREVIGIMTGGAHPTGAEWEESLVTVR
jgi:hypothetical protein